MIIWSIKQFLFLFLQQAHTSFVFLNSLIYFLHFWVNFLLEITPNKVFVFQTVFFLGWAYTLFHWRTTTTMSNEFDPILQLWWKTTVFSRRRWRRTHKGKGTKQMWREWWFPLMTQNFTSMSPFKFGTNETFLGDTLNVLIWGVFIFKRN